jgi:hypothetical protein
MTSNRSEKQQKFQSDKPLYRKELEKNQNKQVSTKKS